MNGHPLFLVFNKKWWQLEREHKVLGYNWTDEELDNADEKGFIGSKFGVDCYLTRPLSAIIKA